MALKRIEMSLYVWDGLLSDQPTTPQYKINKSRITNNTNISLEIGELVRDYLEISFNDYAYTYNIGNVPSELKSHTKWVRALVDYYDESDNYYTFDNPKEFTFIATDGYGYFEDGSNPELERDALISANNIYLPENTTGKLPLFSEGVGKVIIDSTTTQITDNLNTNQKIQYLTIPQNSSVIQVYDTDDTTLKKTITVTNICEPKYTPYKVTFLNRYGAFQDLYFYKKTTEDTSITDEVFKRNIVLNQTSSYQTYESQNQRYNLNSKTKLVMNTGFVLEDMNKSIEELFFSENVWIRYNGKTLPVIPSSKNLAYKTKLNDNLINYTVNFDFAFDKINNIR